MPVLYCENTNCRKEFKSRKSTRKFCSHSCYSEHRKSNPGDYEKGTFKKGQDPWNKGKKSSKHKYDILDINNPRHLKKIIQGCIDGDRKMQNVLFESLYGKMLVVAMRYTKNKDQAEDFVIEGFMKAYEKLHTFKGKHKISSWVGRIIANTAIDYIRKNKQDILGVTDFNGLDYDLEFSTEDEEYDFENVEYIKTIPADVVLKEVQSLSPMYKAVFNMYIFEEYTHKEIAEILGISEGTSKSDLFKAKEVIRNNLHRYVVERDRRSSLNLSLANNNA